MNYIALKLREADAVIQEAWTLVEGTVWHINVKPQQLGMLKSSISTLALKTRQLADYCDRKAL